MKCAQTGGIFTSIYAYATTSHLSAQRRGSQYVPETFPLLSSLLAIPLQHPYIPTSLAMAREPQRGMRDPLAMCGVVGDVVDPFTPCVSLRVIYGSKEVANGCGFRPSAVASRPTILVNGGDNDFGNFYTLVLVDPDSPSPSNPTRREYLHWLVTDINPASTGSGSGVSNLLHTSGQELVSYEPPQPSAGIHRLVFVLFRQAGRLAVRPPEWRANFNTRAFLEYNSLSSPVAVMYYNCQRENGTGGRRFM
ncbi:hypothetical protein Taro_052922 [Colocasia esculenta]|uniref:Uncharacterized protein n=1 Tax=Colocasia esculenta TaxID=4460 RepID=A0A843XLA9_COLES|nr:hypothetical protein [Colocasia esculenta]